MTGLIMLGHIFSLLKPAYCLSFLSISNTVVLNLIDVTFCCTFFMRSVDQSPLHHSSSVIVAVNENLECLLTKVFI